jgi:hypothetical protein
LCHLLLVGCAGPTEVADQQTRAPVVGQAPSANGEQNPVPFQLEPAARPRNSVDAPVAQKLPSEQLWPFAFPKATTEPQSGNGRPTITFEKTAHDYGQIRTGSKSVCEFRFKNTGTATLIVDPQITSTCGCTVTTLAKTEYAPGEEGVLKVTYAADNLATQATRYLTVRSNDVDHPQVRLTITADILPWVAFEPRQLDLSLKDNAVTCPPIILRSLDGTPFSVTAVLSSGNCLTAAIDPSIRATEFTVQPTLDLEKLRTLPTGYLAFMLTHPECKQVKIAYAARTGFRFVPALPMFFNAKPSIPVEKAILLSNDYGEDFEIASFSSERSFVQVREKAKIAPGDKGGTGYRLQVSVTPPAKTTDAQSIFTDTLLVHLTNGQTLRLDCRGFYAATPAGNQ